MSQPELSAPGRPPEATHVYETTIVSRQLHYLTGLALLDETVIGDQVRSAVALYDAAPHELRFLVDPVARLQLRPPQAQRVRLSYTAEELACHTRLDFQTQQERLPRAIGLYSVLGRYLNARLGDPELTVKVDVAVERYRQRAAALRQQAD